MEIIDNRIAKMVKLNQGDGSLVNYPPPLHSIFYNNTKSGKGSSLVNLLHFADYKSQCAIENKTGLM